MARRTKAKASFAGIPRNVVNHPDFYNLSGNAIKLLVQLAEQYRGKNNGKLCAIFNQLKAKGWRSEATLRRAIVELMDAELIVLAKHGFRGYGGAKPNYYALTWECVDDISGFETDISPTNRPLRTFHDIIDKTIPKGVPNRFKPSNSDD